MMNLFGVFFVGNSFVIGSAHFTQVDATRWVRTSDTSLRTCNSLCYNLMPLDPVYLQWGPKSSNAVLQRAVTG